MPKSIYLTIIVIFLIVFDFFLTNATTGTKNLAVFYIKFLIGGLVAVGFALMLRLVREAISYVLRSRTRSRRTVSCTQTRRLCELPKL